MATIHVDQGGMPGAFTTIQAAINSATTGDTIIVHDGTYNENVLIDRSITLQSASGRGSTTIQGSIAGANNATVTVAGGVDNVTVQGFTMIGFDRGNSAIENPTFEIVSGGADATENLHLFDNDFVAKGDGALASQWQMALINAVVTGNIFSGQTFVGPTAGGPGGQFDIPNVPRQLVALGQGSYPGNLATGLVFSNNQITGVAAGVNALGMLVGDNLVTIDASNSTITNNTFAGYTIAGRFDFRARGSNNIVQNNTIDHDAQDSTAAGFSISDPAGVYGGNIIEGSDLGETLVGAPGSDIVHANGGNDIIVATAGNDVIDGGGGVDTYDMTLAGPGGAFVDLASGIAFSSLTGSDTLANIENIKGSAGADTLNGDAFDNVFIATAGADIIDGRGGSDTFDASSAVTSVNVNLTSGSVTGAFVASLASVENAIGGSGNDTFTGNAAANTFIGGGGFDQVTYSSPKANATIAWNAGAGGYGVTTAGGGTDILVGIEKVDFSGADVWFVTNAAELTNALTNAGIGDTIKLAAGTYSGNFTISTQGLTLESATGNAADVVLKGTFRASNGIPNGTDTDDWLAARTQAQGGYTGVSGTGLKIGASDVTVNNITIDDFYQGVEISGASPLSNITLNGVAISNFLAGIIKPTTQSLTNLDILGGDLRHGVQGIEFLKDIVTGQNISDVTIDGTNFLDLVWKGIYAETLNGNSVFDNITMTNVGHIGRIPTFGGTTYDSGSGIELNLKFGAYVGTATIGDFTLVNVGTSAGLWGLTPHTTGSAIALKGRDDPGHGTYGPNPADLTGFSVVVEHGSINGTSTGIRLGEPGKANPALNVTGMNVIVTDVDILNNLTSAGFGDIDNVSHSTITVNLTGGQDTLVSAISAASAGPIVVHANGGDDTVTTASGNDTLYGDGGNDTLNGAGGIDTAVYATDLLPTNVAFNATLQRWIVTAGTEGVDQLVNIEIIDDNGAGGSPRILLVGAGGFTTIQAAIDAAAIGDTIMVGSGTYDEDLNINKAVTILGMQAGHAGTDVTRNAASNVGETTIIGHQRITATAAVTIDGVRFLNDGTTMGGGPTDPTLWIGNGFNHVVTNSIFYSSVNGAANGVDDRAIGMGPIPSGSVTISNNYVTGAFANGFGGGSWGRGIWFDGGGVALNVDHNTFEYTRTGLNLDMSGASTATVASNSFVTNGTAFSVGLALSGVTFTSNNFNNVGDEFNFRNLTSDINFDALAAVGTVTPILPTTDAVVIYGGIGNDTLKGTQGADYIDDNAAGTPFDSSTAVDNDRLEGRGGNDFLVAGFGDDWLDGGSGNDNLSGGAGTDTLIGGTGSDIADGGIGNDTFKLEKAFSAYTITLNAGVYTIIDIANGDTDTVSNVENFDFNGTNVSVVGNPNAIVTASGPTILSITEGALDEDGSSNTIAVTENAVIGTQVAIVNAQDANIAAGDTLTFSLVTPGGMPYSGPFSITQLTATTAEIRVAGVVNFESASNHAFVVRVADALGHSTTQAVPVFVLNENDAPTGIVLSNNSVVENNNAGVVVGTLTAVDEDVGDTHMFSVNDARFEIFNNSGVQELRLKAGQSLDFETEPTINLSITTTDQGGLPYVKQFVLNVTNVNEPPTVIGAQSAQMELGATETALNLVAPVDPEGGPVTMTVTQLPTAGFVRLNGVGVTLGQMLTAAQFAALVFTAPNVDAGPGNDIYSLQFTYSDGVSAPAPLNVTLTVTPAVNGNFVGDAGVNRIDGAAGNDVLNGLGGADTLIGGIGNDHFVFRTGSGADTIVDFAAGAGVVDVINLKGFAGVNAFTDVLSHATQVGADTFIDLGGGDTITLKNVLKTALVADDFAIGAFEAPLASVAGFGSSAVAGGWSSNNTYPRVVADVNGDGLADIVGFGGAGTFVALSNGDGTFASTTLGIGTFGADLASGGWSTNDHYLRTLGDVNGDGRADIVGFGGAGAYVSLANPNGTFQTPTLGTASFGADLVAGGWASNNVYARELADVNGDGRADIVGFGGAGAYVALSTGNGTFTPAFLGIGSFGNDLVAGGWESSDKYPRTLADVNGDGRADIVGFGGEMVYVALGNANGTFQAAQVGIGSFGQSLLGGGWSSQNTYPRLVADVNDDGRADIVGFGSAGTYVALGQSNGTFGGVTLESAAFGSGFGTNDTAPRVLGDVNGDGSADIVGFGSTGVMLGFANDWIV